MTAWPRKSNSVRLGRDFPVDLRTAEISISYCDAVLVYHYAKPAVTDALEPHLRLDARQKSRVFDGWAEC